MIIHATVRRPLLEWRMVKIGTTSFAVNATSESMTRIFAASVVLNFGKLYHGTDDIIYKSV